MTLKEEAAAAALKIVEKIAAQKADYIGLGTGSTADPFTRMLAESFKAGTLPERPVCVTSFATENLCHEVGLIAQAYVPENGLKVVVDGADEVVLETGDVIKGGGGAALAEKDIARAALQSGGEFIVVVDESKISNQLGTVFRYGVPVHVRPALRFITEKKLKEMFDCEVRLRSAIPTLEPDKPLKLENGKSGIYGPLITLERDFILDVRFHGTIPSDFEERALKLPGVTGTGLFRGNDSPTRIIVAGSNGICEVITPNGRKLGCCELLK